MPASSHRSNAGPHSSERPSQMCLPRSRTSRTRRSGTLRRTAGGDIPRRTDAASWRARRGHYERVRGSTPVDRQVQAPAGLYPARVPSAQVCREAGKLSAYQLRESIQRSSRRACRVMIVGSWKVLVRSVQNTKPRCVGRPSTPLRCRVTTRLVCAAHCTLVCTAITTNSGDRVRAGSSISIVAPRRDEPEMGCLPAPTPGPLGRPMPPRSRAPQNKAVQLAATK